MQPTRKILGDWLASLVEELKDHMSEGCARYPNWRSVIVGSLKKLRDVESQLNISVHLKQHKVLPSQDPTDLSPAPTSKVGTNIDERLVFTGNDWSTLDDLYWLNPINTRNLMSPEAVTTNEVVHDESSQTIIPSSQPSMHPSELIEIQKWNDPCRHSRDNPSEGALDEVHFLSPSLNSYDQYFQASPSPEFDFDVSSLYEQTLNDLKFQNFTPDSLPPAENKLNDNAMVQSHASSEHQCFQSKRHDSIHATPYVALN